MQYALGRSVSTSSTCMYHFNETTYTIVSEITVPNPRISESCIKIKINLRFSFHSSRWGLTGFIKEFNAFIKPFEALQRSAKFNISVNFLSLSGIATGRVNAYNLRYLKDVRTQKKHLSFDV